LSPRLCTSRLRGLAVSELRSSRRTLAVFRRPPTVAALPVHPFATAAE